MPKCLSKLWNADVIIVPFQKQYKAPKGFFADVPLYNKYQIKGYFLFILRPLAPFECLSKHVQVGK